MYGYVAQPVVSAVCTCCWSVKRESGIRGSESDYLRRRKIEKLLVFHALAYCLSEGDFIFISTAQYFGLNTTLKNIYYTYISNTNNSRLDKQDRYTNILQDIYVHTTYIVYMYQYHIITYV